MSSGARSVFFYWDRMFTSIHSIRLKLAATSAAVMLAACGGGGSSAPPPTGGLTLDPGDGQVTVRWAATSGVDYWLGWLAAATVSLDIGSPHTWVINVSSPFVLPGLANGTTYAFSVDGRIGGGPGGTATPSMATVPRPGGATWNAGTPPALGATDMHSIAYGTASDTTVDYVAVGNTSAVYKGTDGINWTQVTTTGLPSSGFDFHAATYAFSNFIAGGSGGQIYYSSDMATWTAANASSVSSQPINAMASNGTIVVAVGNGGTILYSGNATTWAAAATVPSGTGNLNGVTYAATGIWLAVGDNGKLLTSTDGSNWTAQTNIAPALTSSINLKSVSVLYTASTGVYTYVAVGTGGTVLTSTNATTGTAATWASATVGGGAYDLNAVVVPSTNTQLLTVGTGGAVYTSPNGMTWTDPRVAATTVGTCNANTSDWLGMISAAAPIVQYVAVGNGGVSCNSH